MITAFLTFLRATKRPVNLWMAMETAPNLPSPKFLIIAKSSSVGEWIDSFFTYLSVRNLIDDYIELVGLPYFVDVSSDFYNLWDCGVVYKSLFFFTKVYGDSASSCSLFFYGVLGCSILVEKWICFEEFHILSFLKSTEFWSREY